MYIYIYKIEIGKKDTSKGMGGRGRKRYEEQYVYIYEIDIDKKIRAREWQRVEEGERDMQSNMYISMKLI